MSARAWLVDTDSESWVFSYEQDARDKAHDLFHDGEDEAAVVPLVPETDLDKLRAEVASLRAALEGLLDCMTATPHMDGTFSGVRVSGAGQHRAAEAYRKAHAALAGRGPEARGEHVPDCAFERTLGWTLCSCDAKPSPDVRGLLEAVDAVTRSFESTPLTVEQDEAVAALAAKRKEWL